jgi:hypothetical protein
MIGLYLVTGRRVAGSWAKAVWPMVVAYAFAWTGHFFIEGNRPATFLYPSYSLMVRVAGACAGAGTGWYEWGGVRRPRARASWRCCC